MCLSLMKYCFDFKMCYVAFVSSLPVSLVSKGYWVLITSGYQHSNLKGPLEAKDILQQTEKNLMCLTQLYNMERYYCLGFLP